MKAGGRLLLRIENIDAARCRPEFEAALLQDLAWLGLVWETPPRRQSEHLGDYRAALARLGAHGVLYRCFRTRSEALARIGSAPHGPEADEHVVHAPLPPEQERELLEAGRPFAWRLSVSRALARLGAIRLTFEERGQGPKGERGLIEADPARVGDVVIGRKDVGVSYHLAVVVDDALQGVSHVVRGHDLFAATHVQRLLQALLNLPTPVYHHHRLLLRPDGRRFAKRDTAETLRSLRADGLTAGELRQSLGFG